MAAVAAEAPAGNKDANYQLLRTGAPEQSFAVNGVKLQRDVANIELVSGKVFFLPAVKGRRVLAVFSGEGHITVAPKAEGEAAFLTRVSGTGELQETFDEALLAFTDGTYEELAKGEAGGGEAGAEVLGRFRKKLRTNREEPRSFLEAMLSGEDVDNVEAEILTDLYDAPGGKGMFNLYMAGRKRKDLRFLARPRGALPSFSSTEEVALVQVDPGGMEEAVLYMSPYAGTAAGTVMERAAFDAERYTIDSTIDGKKLSATAAVEMRARRAGARVIRFGLLPNLRVSKVALAGRELDFIQERAEEDGSLYVILPEPAAAGAAYRLEVEYKGDKVVRREGGGNYSVGARTSWYPSLNSFQDRARFDLTFRSQPRLVLVSVGKKTEDSVENKMRRTRWVSELPLAVAGFNMGQFKSHELTDEAIGNYVIQGYASDEVPSYMKTAAPLPGQREEGVSTNRAPSMLIKSVMSEAQASMRLFTNYFGPAPYGRIALTQQPEFNFGQSWPGLVYLPVSAFLDATTRWAMLGSDTFRFSEFVQEVTAHEVAHQWWGHIVGWASYRDQWLSEGFADFSASLFLQATRKGPADYHKYIDRWREAVLERNRFGVRANDVGPVSLGLRLNIPKVPGAYSRVVYSKGGYVLHMLRMLMLDPQAGDRAFVAMMREFVATRNNEAASTADFQRIAEKHFPQQKNPDPNGKLDWFFNQWVHGQEIPSYRMGYSLTPAERKTVAKFQLTQSGVGPGFVMPVGIYGNIGGRMVKLGQAILRGSMTGEEYTVELPADTKDLTMNYNRDVLAEKVEVVRR